MNSLILVALFIVYLTIARLLLDLTESILTIELNFRLVSKIVSQAMVSIDSINRTASERESSLPRRRF